MNYKWYIANVVAGQENKICNEINSIVEKHQNDETFPIKKAVIPVKMITKVKNGKKIQEEQKLFPGYVFVNMCLEGTNAFGIVRTLPKVMGFLGQKNKPQVVSDTKMSSILDKMENSANNAEQEDIFEIGETVKVIQGPFESFTGIVEDKDVEKKRLKISVSIFGRTTSVDLDVSQVEKLD
jgi:transcriptional antiterminator NusG